MKVKYSIIACILISLTFVSCRFVYTDYGNGKALKITTWDALGYYMYLPATLIYHDASALKWFPEIDSTYDVSGGKLYQANKNEDGKYVFKYLGGIAVLQLPFFLVSHTIAQNSAYAADGFSAPYQYGMAFGALVYFILTIFLLRHLLLKYFSDKITALSLLSLFGASNVIQYVSIDSAMSHSYILLLYPVLIYATIKWHEKPTLFWASTIGWIIGMATICRPTEALMFLIPLFWNTQNKEQSKLKWTMVKENLNHLIFVGIFGLIGILPQLIYWQIITGSPVYDVGSKWTFLNPFFRVLFGWEKGWFIYTPIAIAFIVGLFFIKKFPFKKSIIIFTIMNIWVVISWFDWNYGATYSCRALSQSTPLFAFPLAALLTYLFSIKSKLKYLVYPIGIYLIAVNLFQIGQYNSTVLHYYDMNRKYYGAIYLDKNPTPLDMSLLDTDIALYDEGGYNSVSLGAPAEKITHTSQGNRIVLMDTVIELSENDAYLCVQSELTIPSGSNGRHIQTVVLGTQDTVTTTIRLNYPNSNLNSANPYHYYTLLPKNEKKVRVVTQVIVAGKTEVIEENSSFRLLTKK